MILMSDTELHAHLYGSLLLDDLYYLYSRNKPRWSIFTESFKKSYFSDPDLSGLFEKSDHSRKRLEKYYYYLSSGNFSRFQTSFDLVIALSSTEPEELQEILKRVSGRMKGYSELRMLFSPFDPPEAFSEKVGALCEAIASENRVRPLDAPLKLAVSLNREEGLYQSRYGILKHLQSVNPSVKKELTAIDFCAKEEGFPPSEKYSFVQNVLKENEAFPESSLAVLYHVGESFSDKSVESASRWVLESALMGCHRLGHGIALGIDPSLYSGRNIKEHKKERISHIEFLFQYECELKDFGYSLNLDELQAERNTIEKMPEDEVIIHYDDKTVEKTRIFQNWAMEKIKKTDSVIEVCPTSNQRIANIKVHDLPLWRFIENDLDLVIGSDDPGILKISLEDEFVLIQNELKKKNLDEKILEGFVKNAEKSISEKLSKRLI